MIRSGFARATVLALALIALGAADPLDEETVVRWFVAGTPVPQIVERIEAAEVAFDLSDEMLAELELAGLPDELIEAMRRRQRELAAPAPPAPLREAGVELARLEIDLRAKGDGGHPVVRVGGTVDYELRERWQLGRQVEGASFEDLAVFVACRTAMHVPDHWRSESPLGEDFSAPRHRMHAFVAGADEQQSGIELPISASTGPLGARLDAVPTAGGETLKLVLPDVIEVELPPGEPHDLSLGVAVAVDGQYYVAAEAQLDGLVLEPGTTRRFAKIESSARRPPSAIEIVFTDASGRALGEEPTPEPAATAPAKGGARRSPRRRPAGPCQNGRPRRNRLGRPRTRRARSAR